MNEEEKAIEYFKKQTEICVENANICDKNNFDEEAKFLREEKDYIDTVIQALEQKDKIIDLMAIAINNYDAQLVINTYKNKEDVIRKFKEMLED